MSLPFLTFFIRGICPPSKKNSEEIVRFNGHSSLAPSKQYKAQTALAIPQLIDQFARQVDDISVAYAGLIQMKCLFHVLYKSTQGTRPDLMNLLHAPADWLQPPKVPRVSDTVPHKVDAAGKVTSPGAGVILDDRQVVSVDGSRVVCVCDGCLERRSGCNFRYETRLKKDGEPRYRRNGKLMRDKIQVCKRGGITIELYRMDEP